MVYTRDRRFLSVLLILVWMSTFGASRVYSDQPATAAASVDTRLPDAPHADALIEWWYANAHVTTTNGKHLAIVCAFFKFGANSQSPIVGIPSIKPGHYLIYQLTDLDRKTQRAYSYADTPMVEGLKLLLSFGGGDSHAAAMLGTLLKGKLPAPHQFMNGPVGIADSPLLVHYGDAGSFAAVGGVDNSYHLKLGGKDAVDITLTSMKPVMPVGGKGETGLVKPTDMYYYSLTRCNVTGDIDGAHVKTGQGWIDHQWGSSWTTQKAGWDWWGVQLDNGADILFFQQRDLSTGKTFFPLATFMDKDGNLTVTKNIAFRPVPDMTWRSPSGARYPIAWDVGFPDQNLDLRITADVAGQEMPILTPGGNIWEGSCSVIGISSMGTRLNPGEPGMPRHSPGYIVKGVAYMELVGYSHGVVGHSHPGALPHVPARKRAK